MCSFCEIIQTIIEIDKINFSFDIYSFFHLPINTSQSPEVNIVYYSRHTHTPREGGGETYNFMFNPYSCRVVCSNYGSFNIILKTF